jgi:hypothetical protein
MITEVFLEEWEYRNRASNLTIWFNCDSPAFIVLDDRGNYRKPFCRVRHMFGDLWLCMDDDGILIVVKDDAIQGMRLAQDDSN